MCGISRQEYWSGLPFPSPGNLPNPGIKPMSLALAGRFFTTESPGKHPKERPEQNGRIRTLGSLLWPGCRLEVGEEQSGDADKFQPVRPLDLAKKLSFDRGSSQ